MYDKHHCCIPNHLLSLGRKTAITFRRIICLPQKTNCNDGLGLAYRDDFLFSFMSPMIENEFLPKGKYQCIVIYAVVLLGHLNADYSIL